MKTPHGGLLGAQGVGPTAQSTSRAVMNAIAHVKDESQSSERSCRGRRRAGIVNGNAWTMLCIWRIWCLCYVCGCELMIPYGCNMLACSPERLGRRAALTLCDAAPVLPRVTPCRRLPPPKPAAGPAQPPFSSLPAPQTHPCRPSISGSPSRSRSAPPSPGRPSPLAWPGSPPAACCARTPAASCLHPRRGRRRWRRR